MDMVLGDSPTFLSMSSSKNYNIIILTKKHNATDNSQYQEKHLTQMNQFKIIPAKISLWTMVLRGSFLSMSFTSHSFISLSSPTYDKFDKISKLYKLYMLPNTEKALIMHWPEFLIYQGIC